MFWVIKNAVVWADLGELALSWWRVICLRPLVFPISWKTTGKQIVVYHSELTVMRCSSPVQCFWKNRRLIAWKSFVHGQLLLSLVHLETLIQSTSVYFRPHMRKSTIHHLSRCHRHVSKHRDRIFWSISFKQSTWAFFWAIEKLCAIQRKQICLTVKCSCNIECMLHT